MLLYISSFSERENFGRIEGSCGKFVNIYLDKCILYMDGQHREKIERVLSFVFYFRIYSWSYKFLFTEFLTGFISDE